MVLKFKEQPKYADGIAENLTRLESEDNKSSLLIRKTAQLVIFSLRDGSFKEVLREYPYTTCLALALSKEYLKPHLPEIKKYLGEGPVQIFKDTAVLLEGDHGKA